MRSDESASAPFAPVWAFPQPWFRRFRPWGIDHGFFFLESIRSLSISASLFPSSRHLSRALIRHVNFRKATVLVELGIGTGAVTGEILKRMRPDARLYAIDINPSFIVHIKKVMQDPRLVPIVGEAEHLADILGGLRVGPADAIVSSLGLTNMAETQRARIMAQAARHLRRTGVLAQYQYLHANGEPNWLSRIGVMRFREERFLRQYFRQVVSERVIVNLPPARVFTCRR